MEEEEKIHDEKKDFLYKVGGEASLKEAWKQLNKSNPDSFRLSGETVSQFHEDLESQIPTISKSILA